MQSVHQTGPKALLAFVLSIQRNASCAGSVGLPKQRFLQVSGAHPTAPLQVRAPHTLLKHSKYLHVLIRD